MKKISAIKKEWLRDRIDELSRKGISKADVARRLEVMPQYLNSLLNTDRGITDQFLDKFIEVFCISHFDLFAGILPSNGEPPATPPPPTTVCERNPLDIELIKAHERTIARDEQLISSLYQRISELEGNPTPEALDSARSVDASCSVSGASFISSHRQTFTESTIRETDT